MPVAAERNLESFIAQALKADHKKLPPGNYRDMVEETSAMSNQLSTDRLLEARKTWDKNLIVGSAEDELYLLVGESPKGNREQYSILWTTLFEPHEDDDGEMLPYFQWAERCGVEDRATLTLKDAVFNTLAKHYDSQGVAPLVPNANVEFQMAVITVVDTEEDTDEDGVDDDKLTYHISTDSW